MANIQDKIAKQFPDATFEDGEILLVNIPDLLITHTDRLPKSGVKANTR